MQGSGFRVWDSGCRVQGSGFRVQGLVFRVQGLGFRAQGVECTSVVVDERRRLSMVATALWTVPTNATAACGKRKRFHG